MEPASFPESNAVMDTPIGWTPEDCVPLAVFRDGKHIISRWKLTPAELEEINRTGSVWLWVFGNGMPPVAITAQCPFSRPEPETTT